jgi:NADPH:quinone reductase-like Zn-dependent oxidoreductase
VAWLDPQPGEVVLIQGGSGLVGSIAIQLAVARGATVIATTGDSSADYVTSLGAIPVPYGDEMIEHVRKVSSRVDGAIDAAGLGALSDLITLRGSADRVVSLADPAAIEMGLPFLPGGPEGHNVDVLAELAEMVLNGAVKLRTAKSYPLAEAAAAQELNATGHAAGKVLLDVAHR